MQRKDDGRPIKRARQAARLSQGELAWLLRKSHTTIYLLERPGPLGMQTCSEELAIALAHRLSRDVEDLFDAKRSPRVADKTTVTAVA